MVKNKSAATMRMINPITLVPGLNYKISAWMKASGMAEGTFESVTIGLNTLNEGHGVAAIQIFYARATTEPVKIDWTYRSKIFSVETETKVIPYFYSGFNDFWIDDVKLIIVE